MSDEQQGPASALVVATYSTVDRARSTVRSVLAWGEVSCVVVDVDGTYRPVAGERVVRLAEAVHALDAVHEARAAVATLEADDLELYAGVLGAEHLLAAGASQVAVLGAGVVVLSDLRPFLERTGSGAAVLPALDSSALGRIRAATMVGHALEFGPVRDPDGAGPVLSRALVGLGADAQAPLLRRLTGDWRLAPTALDAFATTTGATVVRDDAQLVSAWRGVPAQLRVDESGRVLLGGEPVLALDLTRFDPEKPWVLDAAVKQAPAVRLSEHPELLDLVAAEAAMRRAEAERTAEELPARLPARLLVDRVLRGEARRADLVGGDLPDLLDLTEGDDAPDLATWATQLVPHAHRHPVARYLLGVRAQRRGLQVKFPQVPGKHSAELARWALTSGVDEPDLDRDLLRTAAEATLAAQPGEVARRAERPPGVNVVGYLSGELGLGESGRLMDAALHAAGVPSSTFDVSRRIVSRTNARYRVSEPVMYDTTLLCVNDGETPGVVRQLRDVTQGTRKIGMWYWELEKFPATRRAGFAHVDEIWAATDFIARSVGEHADVAVRTVMPPLPQRADVDPGPLPERFGIAPGRPFFLFTFDYLSSAERKNPYGLVEAFRKAFPEERPDGPMLVIKTINGDREPADSERLLLTTRDRGDVVVVDEYLENHERHVLVAHCTAYVSLHKAEGLGLTPAEAMAWGKPVIATRYGGVVQFMNDANSLLVGWERAHLPETIGPYEKGMPWAEPDLDEAAAKMRLVVEDPVLARRLGEQAARDIRELHSIEAAGARIREVLDEGRAEWEATRAAARAARRAEREAGRDAERDPRQPPAERPLARRVASRIKRRLT